MLNFAANLSFTYQEYEFLDRFATAAQDGFKGVEFLFPYQYQALDIKQQLQQFNLKQVLFNCPPGNWEKGDRGLSSIPGRDSEFRDGVALVLDYAQALDCHQIHVMAGVIADDQQFQKYEETYLRNIAYAAQSFGEAGISVLLEVINRGDIPGYFLHSLEQAARYLETLSLPNVGLQFDLYHMQIIHGKLPLLIKQHFNSIKHCQIAGVPGRHEPNIGELPYVSAFKQLEKMGYQGWIGCEYHPVGKTSEGLNWIQDYQDDYR